MTLTMCWFDEFVSPSADQPLGLSGDLSRKGSTAAVAHIPTVDDSNNGKHPRGHGVHSQPTTPASHPSAFTELQQDTAEVQRNREEGLSTSERRDSVGGLPKGTASTNQATHSGRQSGQPAATERKAPVSSQIDTGQYISPGNGSVYRRCFVLQ